MPIKQNVLTAKKALKPNREIFDMKSDTMPTNRKEHLSYARQNRESGQYQPMCENWNDHRDDPRGCDNPQHN